MNHVMKVCGTPKDKKGQHNHWHQTIGLRNFFQEENQSSNQWLSTCMAPTLYWKDKSWRWSEKDIPLVLQSLSIFLLVRKILYWTIIILLHHSRIWYQINWLTFSVKNRLSECLWDTRNYKKSGHQPSKMHRCMFCHEEHPIQFEPIMRRTIIELVYPGNPSISVFKDVMMPVSDDDDDLID